MNRKHQSARPMITKQKITGHIQPPNDEPEVLKKHYPQFFDKNGHFDFRKFKNHLAAKEVDFSKETYTLDWLGLHMHALARVWSLPLSTSAGWKTIGIASYCSHPWRVNPKFALTTGNNYF